MENLLLVGFVFALGVVIHSLKLYFDAHRATYRDLDEFRGDFQQRVNTWQRSQMSRMSSLKETADTISGQLYQADLESWKNENNDMLQISSDRVPQKFKLMD